MTNHPNRSKVDRSALISDVHFFEGCASFRAGGRKLTYWATRGSIYANSSGEPVHQSSDGSYCIVAGRALDEIISYANLLGGKVSFLRE